MRWSTKIAAPPAGGVVVAGGATVVPLQDESLIAHALRDGSVLWTIEIAPTQPLAADGERVYVVAGEVIQAVAVRTGHVTWRVSAGGAITAPPLAHAGWVIVSAAGELLAVRAADGQTVWRLAVGLVEFRPALDGDLLIAVAEDGHVLALDLPTGGVRWRRALGARPTEPFVLGNSVYVGTDAKWFYALRASDGRRDWRWRGAVVRGRAAADDRHIYYAGMDNMLRAIDRRNGALRWQSGLPYRPLAGPVILPGGAVVPGTVQALPVFRRTDGGDAGQIRFAAELTALPAFGADPNGAPLVIGVLGSLQDQWTITLLEGSLVPAMPLAPLKELPGEVVPIAGAVGAAAGR